MFLLFCGLFPVVSHAQLTDGVTGLLHMPSAEMQKDGTLMIGGNFMNNMHGDMIHIIIISMSLSSSFWKRLMYVLFLKGKTTGDGLNRHGGSL